MIVVVVVANSELEAKHSEREGGARSRSITWDDIGLHHYRRRAPTTDQVLDETINIDGQALQSPVSHIARTLSLNMAHVLPDLPYGYNALEPYISQQIMELHHKKHHQTYVNSLNAAEQAYTKASTPKERIALQAALKFNGGGEFSTRT